LARIAVLARMTISGMPLTRSDRRAIAVIGGLAGVAAISGVSLCPFATLTGLPCPGCGLLRAALALARGDVAESFHIHPLALVVLPVAAFAVLRLRSATPLGQRAGALLVGCLTATVLALFGLWIARLGGAFGGPVAVHSVWSAIGTPSPFARALTR
jgi:hypothetical protein